MTYKAIRTNYKMSNILKARIKKIKNEFFLNYFHLFDHN